ncbi:hypothetical protein RRG08_060189 [Elysia crispata]|uniref:Uncharacterized protein n=1 Tax=Elysia crispata TaxID=231223 RepID=A0AAE0ZZN8_9GAST|nr:hypothetical protein RRG08_060189 [Elysia crispata]
MVNQASETGLPLKRNPAKSETTKMILLEKISGSNRFSNHPRTDKTSLTQAHLAPIVRKLISSSPAITTRQSIGKTRFPNTSSENSPQVIPALLCRHLFQQRARGKRWRSVISMDVLLPP